VLIGQDENFWTGNESSPAAKIATILQDFQKVAKIFSISNNLFAQLHPWKVSTVTFSANSSEMADTLLVDVRPPVELSDDRNGNRTANSSGLLRASKWPPGYRFFVIRNSSGDFSEAATSGGMEILGIYVPVGICSMVVLLLLLIFAGYSRSDDAIAASFFALNFANFLF
jgi:hypothetical protein